MAVEDSILFFDEDIGRRELTSRASSEYRPLKDEIQGREAWRSTLAVTDGWRRRASSEEGGKVGCGVCGIGGIGGEISVRSYQL